MVLMFYFPKIREGDSCELYNFIKGFSGMGAHL